MRRRFLCVCMIGALVCSMAACSTSTNQTTSDSTESASAVESTTEITGQNENAINDSIYDVTREEVEEKTDIPMCPPAGASDVTYNIISASAEEPIAEMEFTYEGQKMYLRAQKSDLLPPDESDLDEVNELIQDQTYDISGLYYEWDSMNSITVADRFGYACASEEGPGYAAWVDPVPGIMYNLCMEEDADVEDLEDLANEVWVPVDGESYSDEDIATTQAEFQDILQQLYDVKPGTTGSEDRANKAVDSIAAFVEKYGEKFNYNTLSTLAEEQMEALVEQNGEATKERVSDALDEVCEIGTDAYPDLETDVAYNQLINAIASACEAE